MAEQAAVESVETRQAIGQPQGERLVAVETLLPTLATKTDVAEIRTENAETRLEIAHLRTEVRTENANTRAELKSDNSDLRHDLTRFQTSIESKLSTIHKLLMILCAVITAAVGLTALFLRLAGVI